MNRAFVITAFFLFFTLWQCLPFAGGQNYQRWSFLWKYRENCAYAQEGSEKDRPDIQWFKKELRISPKYQEKEPGILGLSWAHFLVMVFLVVSFIIALVALFVRHRRAKELISMLIKEEDSNGEKG
jgi:hypothetical protein